MASELRPHTRGQRPEICAICREPRLDPTHRSPHPSGRWLLGPEERAAARVAATDRDRARRAARRAPLAVPRELVMLAYLLDEILELEPDAAGWRVLLRARSLREALPPEIPRADRAPHIAELDGEVSMPAPVSDEPAQREPAPDSVASPSTYIEHVPPAQRARARAMTKSIADKAARELATRAIVAGYSLRRTGGGHWILERPGQSERLTLPNRVAGYERGWKNLRAHAQRLGIDVEGL